MMRRQLLAVLLITLSASCRRADWTDTIVTTVDSAGIRITTIIASAAVLPEWALAPSPGLTLADAATGDSTAFTHISAARWLRDGRIVVADAAARRLLLFDSAGRFVRPLGRSGQGPGEFRNLGEVTVIPGDSLTTFDASLRRLSVWHPDSGFVRSTQVVGTSLESSPSDAWLWRDGRIVVLQLSITPRDSIAPASGVRRWPMRAQLALQDTSGSVLATSAAFDGMYTGIYEGGDTRLPFSNQPFSAISRDRVYFGSGSTFTIAYLDSDFTRAGELRWPAQREDLTQAEVEAVKSEAMALAAKRLPPDQLAKRCAMNFARAILPRERPAIGRVFLDDEERLWVGRFEATRLGSLLQKPSDRWTVISKNGEPVARLRLPESSRLEDVRGARVLLVVRDSLDVQTIAVRDIVKQ